jgi:hypothetical protein
MTGTMTRDQVAAALTAAITERHSIQANLLELEGSFGKRLLAGAALTGVSKQRWTGATADLTALWEIFTSYAAVLDEAAELFGKGRRLDRQELHKMTSMLNAPSVELAQAPAPLAGRDVTDRGRRHELTLAQAVAEMKERFARVAVVVTAAESVWAGTADDLGQVDAALRAASQQVAAAGDDELTGQLAAAGTELSWLRGVLNSDPLTLWSGGRVDSTRLDRLRGQADAIAAQAADLARLRVGVDQRITEIGAAVAAVAAARRDALAARDRAAAKIATALPPLPPEAAGLDERLAALSTLKDAGRWARLAAELDAIAAEAAAARQRYADSEGAAVALLRRRDELRGLLDAYRAKAARLGAAEDAGLVSRYQQARDLLWTAPCDLTAASVAVLDYQQAIRQAGDPGEPR